MKKSDLRVRYKQMRAALSEEDMEDKSLAIANRLLELPIWEYTYYHLFLSISEKKEVQTGFILHILQGRDKSIVVSKSDFNTGEMEHILLQENTLLKLSPYGIPEPEEGISISAEILEVIFVPLLAFDKKGGRIGYGKGFYDRFLKKCPENALFIGLSFFEAEESVPTTAEDVPLSYCVTPQKIYSF